LNKIAETLPFLEIPPQHLIWFQSLTLGALDGALEVLTLSFREV